jgi:hypothetical protein
VLLTQPAVQSSSNHEVVTAQKDRCAPAHPTHTQSCLLRTHAGNGITILLPDKEKTILCLENAIQIAQTEEVFDFLKCRVTTGEQSMVKSYRMLHRQSVLELRAFPQYLHEASVSKIKWPL